MVEPSELREAARTVETEFPRAAVRLGLAANEIETLRRVRDGMTPPPDVRLMHYRAAALTGLTMNALCAHDDLVDRNGARVMFGDHVAREAEAYARAMLAAEGGGR